VRLLSLADCAPEENAISCITSNGWLSSRLQVLTTTEEAIRLYNQVQLIPQSQTRAEVLREENIKIEGQMFVTGAPTAIFLHAFEDKLPKVLKIPQYQNKVLNECALYETISKDIKSTQALALVPVRMLKLSGQYASSPCKALTCGILMPPYVCTLSDIPKPISESTALEIIDRIGSTLQFINQKEWLHGDVKPSNIFVDYNGDFWLGDYGSSLKLSDVMNYAGGTPKYQINEFPIQSLNFDLIGLGLSLLECLELIKYLNCNGNDILTVRNSIKTILNGSLKDKISSLFP
jgi:hypothetical protein